MTMGTIYYRPYKPKKRLRIRRISDRVFYAGVTIIGMFSGVALVASYKFFVG